MSGLIIGYGRISQRGGNDGISLSRQREMVEQYIAFKQLIGDFKFLSDESQSGFKVNRESFQQLVKLVKSKKVSHVIVFDLSRLSRNVRLTLDTVDLMDQHKVTFVSLSEDLRTDTAIGRCFLTICSAFSQMMKDRTSEKMKAMHKFNRENGIFTSGFVPYGFDKVDDRLVENTREQKVIRLICNLYSQNNSFAGISRILNDRGVLPRSGKKFYPNTVRQVLNRSKKYKINNKEIA